jgi:outer membrane protein OmpA-like peptidoglycan-associated protein
MKFFCCILLGFLSSYSAVAQVDIVTIKGTVTTGDNEPVENALIFFRSSRGDSFLKKTDSLGNYEYKIKKDQTSTFTISIGTDKLTKSKNSLSGFLANKDSGSGDLFSYNEYIKNFSLTKVISCGPAPSIRFNTNSIISCNDSLSKIDSIQYLGFDNTINFLYSTFLENPSVIIQLQGHASSIEKNHEALALYRAQLIKEILVAKGINRKRIEVKGWGNHKLLITDLVINKAKTKEEKMILHLKNQRVVFRIISWDFKE